MRQSALGVWTGFIASQFIQNPVAHLGGGGVGKGNGHHLPRLFHLGQQTQKALGEKSRFAGACRSLHQNRPGGVEG